MKIAFVLVAFLLCGCAAYRQAKADYAACYADPACHDMMLAKAKMAGEIGQTAGGASGVPMAGQIAGSVFAAIALLVSGVAGGAALRKRNEPPIVSGSITRTPTDSR